MQEFNVTAMDLGATVLPAVNKGLKDLKSVLEGIRAVLPSQGAATVGARMMEGAAGGALAGGIVGAFGGPVGMVGGAAIGGVLGIAEGYLEQRARETREQIESGQRPYPRPGDEYQHRIEQLKRPYPAPVPPIHLNLNIDGARWRRRYRSSRTRSLSTRPTGRHRTAHCSMGP